MELISVFEPRDKAAILEDNFKKKKISQNLREKELSSQRSERLLFWSTSMASMMSIVAENQQKQDNS